MVAVAGREGNGLYDHETAEHHLTSHSLCSDFDGSPSLARDSGNLHREHETDETDGTGNQLLLRDLAAAANGWDGRDGRNV